MAFADAVEEAALNEAMSRLDTAGNHQATHLDLNPDVSSNGKIISHTWVRQSERIYTQLDELTFLDFVDKRVLEIARDNPPAVHCGYRILPGYAAGVGLQIVVKADVLSRAVIEATITGYCARGECNWSSDVPARIRIQTRLFTHRLTLQIEPARMNTLNPKNTFLIAARLMTAINMRKNHVTNPCRTSPPYVSNEA